MDKMEKDNREYYTIDVLHLLKILWRRAWIIIICGILAAGIGFSVSAFMIAPTYSSSVKLYVNNSSFSVGNSSFSISQLTAAQSLVKTYGEILRTRTTLERVIDKAEVDYTPNYLLGMIKYDSSNETEIMRVTVTCEDPYEASKIANTIAEVLVKATFAITIELASRFLDDYITGDKYFRCTYPKHNLVRTRCQLQLAKDIERKWKELTWIISDVTDNITCKD